MKIETYNQLHAMVRDRMPWSSDVAEILSDSLVRVLDNTKVMKQLDSDDDDERMPAFALIGQIASQVACDRARAMQRRREVQHDPNATKREPSPLAALIVEEEREQNYGLDEEVDLPLWMLSRVVHLPALHQELVQLLGIHGNVPDCIPALLGRFGLSRDPAKCKQQLWNAKRSISKCFADLKP